MRALGVAGSLVGRVFVRANSVVVVRRGGASVTVPFLLRGWRRIRVLACVNPKFGVVISLFMSLLGGS